MTIHRLDNVLIVVDDLDAVISFFLELGMELEGKGPIEGRWVERVIGIDEVRQDVAMLRTPDGHGGIELAMFNTPKAIRPEPKDVPANTLGIRRIMFAVDDIEASRSRHRDRRRRTRPYRCTGVASPVRMHHHRRRSVADRRATRIGMRRKLDGRTGRGSQRPGGRDRRPRRRRRHSTS
jgi:catechol 2,3-dioxygenase-like lactoylglutathione lyase family enzyme